MDNKLLSQYVSIKSKIKELEEKESSLKKAILKDFAKNKMDKVESIDYGKFTVAHRLTYQHSEKIKRMEEEVKIQKQKEIDKGKAIIKSDTTYLLWKDVKTI